MRVQGAEFCTWRSPCTMSFFACYSKELCRVRRHSGLAFKRALPRSTSFRACIQKSFAAFNFVPRLLFKRALLCLTSFRACIQKSFVVFNVIPGLHSKELCRVQCHSGLDPESDFSPSLLCHCVRLCSIAYKLQSALNTRKASDFHRKHFVRSDRLELSRDCSH